MDRDTTVREFVCALKREIEERRTLIAALEARVGSDEKPEPASPRVCRTGMTSAVLDILREAGRPMHALNEVIPALEARGFTVRSKGGFATLMLRTGQVVRTAPGTYALKPAVDAAARS